MHRTALFLTSALLLSAFVSGCGETKSAFHGYYYNDGSQRDQYVKLPLAKAEEAAFKSLLAGGLNDIDEEKYWRSFSRFMITPFPQTYVAWENKSYWIVLADKVGDDHQFVKGKQGIHIFEFIKDKMRYAYRDVEGKDGTDEFSKLVLTGHDWAISGESAKSKKTLSNDEVKVMKQNIGWTDAVHERMQKKFPPEKVKE